MEYAKFNGIDVINSYIGRTFSAKTDHRPKFQCMIKATISEGSGGILLESVLERYAEYYSIELAEKVKRGLTGNALKAKANGGTRTFVYCGQETALSDISVRRASLVVCRETVLGLFL